MGFRVWGLGFRVWVQGLGPKYQYRSYLIDIWAPKVYTLLLRGPFGAYEISEWGRFGFRGTPGYLRFVEFGIGSVVSL